MVFFAETKKSTKKFYFYIWFFYSFAGMKRTYGLKYGTFPFSLSFLRQQKTLMLSRNATRIPDFRAGSTGLGAAGTKGFADLGRRCLGEGVRQCSDGSCISRIELCRKCLTMLYMQLSKIVELSKLNVQCSCLLQLQLHILNKGETVFLILYSQAEPGGVHPVQ